MKSKPISVDKKAIFLNEVKRACEELCEMGLIQDSGRRRNGQVVWEPSPLGKLNSESPSKYKH